MTLFLETPEQSTSEIMADALCRGDQNAVDWSFRANGAAPPSMIWSPINSQISNPIIERFANLCRRKLRPNGSLYRADFTLEEFGSLTDWVMLVDLDIARSRLVYTHYGAGISRHFGRDMTGRTTDDFPSHIGQFFLATYKASARRREWLLTDHEPPEQVFVNSWRRLLVPVHNSNNSVDGFIALNVPENPLRAALDIMPDPVFVLDKTQSIRYTNPKAAELFPQWPSKRDANDFRSITGIDLDLHILPSTMVERNVVDTKVHNVPIADGAPEDVLTTVSAALYRGRAFYIVLARIAVGQRARTT